MSGTVVFYLVYLLVSALLTVWVATTLARHGRVFLTDVFQGDADLANSINRLLQTGFYLLSFGFVALWLQRSEPVSSTREGFEALSVKIGTVLLVLGAVHLLNIYFFNVLRRRRRQKTETRTHPAVSPQVRASPTPSATQPEAGPPRA